jgi:hypothetical protein
MSEFKGTKGTWKAVNNGPHWNNKTIDNWEIQWSEDGECVVDHVYDQYDALLISKAPEMLEMLERIVQSELTPLQIRKECKNLIKSATEL